MVNKPLISPYFWGGTLGGGRLTSHEKRGQQKVCNLCKGRNDFWVFVFFSSKNWIRGRIVDRTSNLDKRNLHQIQESKILEIQRTMDRSEARSYAAPSHGNLSPLWSLKNQPMKWLYIIQEISNGRTHVSRTPKKPEYLIATYFFGVRWDSVPFNFWWT